MTRTLADKITAQAEGVYPAEAAALLITQAFDGRLIHRLPLAWEDDRMAEIDWDQARTNVVGVFSGGERRVFELAASLFTGHPVNLSDATSGLDSSTARIALVALSHALRVRINGGGVR